jgi:hypothetical protein
MVAPTTNATTEISPITSDRQPHKHHSKRIRTKSGNDLTKKQKGMV